MPAPSAGCRARVQKLATTAPLKRPNMVPRKSSLLLPLLTSLGLLVTIAGAQVLPPPNTPPGPKPVTTPAPVPTATPVPIAPGPGVPPPAPVPVPTPVGTPPAPNPGVPVPPVPAPSPLAPHSPKSPTGGDTPGTAKPNSGPPATPTTTATPTPAATPTPPKTIDEVVKDWNKLPGLITLYQHLEGNHQKIMAELTPFDLESTYMVQATFGSGDSKRIVAGSPAGDTIVRWKLTSDDRLILTSPNLWFRATDPNLRNAVGRDFPEAYLDIFPIVAKQPSRNSVLVDFTPFFDGSIIGLDQALQAPPVPGFKGNSYHLDPNSTFVNTMRVFPTNVMMDIQYGFRSEGLEPADTLADPRSLPVKVVYNVYRLPDDTVARYGYHPRRADARVGFFINGQLDASRTGFESLDNDAARDPNVYLINRWRLYKKDPIAKLSAPVQPITFYLDNSIPDQYRDAVRQGILMWNPVFAKLGYQNAIVVKDAPTDGSWDTADMRFNVVRWVASPPSGSSAYAIALLRENPLTGEILNASINVNSNFARIGYYEKQEVIDPLDVRTSEVRTANVSTTGLSGKAGLAGGSGVACELDGQLHDRAMWAREELISRGVKIDDTKYVQELLRATVGHEFGHVLGLRHNFIASTYLTPKQLTDPATVRKLGISASLMDYVGFNIFALNSGADYFPSRPGPYDEWAIRYGYSHFQEDQEAAGLREIASHSNQHGLLYQSDELADDYDPTIVRYDLSSDPIAYIERTLQVDTELLRTLGKREPEVGEPYNLFTGRLRSLLGAKAQRCLVPEPLGRRRLSPPRRARRCR